ncbi:MAG: twin-arginine translocase TatA/TatE family subunit [Opitutaceae bacterium]|nr:twin-arginine translocase TatA/TatE family subunit [Opitutaceae bacterium]
MNFSPLVLGAFGLGGMEILLILAVVLLLFGAKKLPELAKGLGKSIKEFKKASSEDQDDDKPVATATTTEAKKAETVRTDGSH